MVSPFLNSGEGRGHPETSDKGKEDILLRHFSRRGICQFPAWQQRRGYNEIEGLQYG